MNDEKHLGPRIIDGAGIAASVGKLLAAIDEPDREGLKATPERVADFWSEWLADGPPDMTMFESDDADEMIVQVGIPFYSVCEHHLVPFFGTAAVGYIPKGRIVGLSKLTRLIRWVSSRPQNQERIGRQVVEHLSQAVGSNDVGVVLRARHLCMEMRGIRGVGVETVTSRLLGEFKADGKTRGEFLALVNAGR